MVTRGVSPGGSVANEIGDGSHCRITEQQIVAVVGGRYTEGNAAGKREAFKEIVNRSSI